MRRVEVGFGFPEVVARGLQHIQFFEMIGGAFSLLSFFDRAFGERFLLGEISLARAFLEDGHGGAFLLEILESFLSPFGLLMHPDGDGGIHLSSCHLFEQSGPLFFVGEKKSIELALGEKDGSAELIKVEAGLGFDGFANRVFSGGDGLPVIKADEQALFALQAASGFLTGAVNAPAGAVAHVVLTDEVDFREARAGAAAKDGAAVFNGERVAARVGCVFLAVDRNARKGTIEGKTQGIEDGGLAGACRAGDGKEAGTRERLAREIESRTGRRGLLDFVRGWRECASLSLSNGVMKDIKVRCFGGFSELAFEREAEKLLRIAFGQANFRGDGTGLNVGAAKGRNADVDEAHGKLCGHSVDLFAEPRGQTVTRERDVHERLLL